MPEGQFSPLPRLVLHQIATCRAGKGTDDEECQKFPGLLHFSGDQRKRTQKLKLFISTHLFICSTS